MSSGLSSASELSFLSLNGASISYDSRLASVVSVF